MKGPELLKSSGYHPGFRVETHQSVKPYVGDEEILIPVHPDRLPRAARDLTRKQRKELKDKALRRPTQAVSVQPSAEPISVFTARWPKNVTAIKLGPRA